MPQNTFYKPRPPAQNDLFLNLHTNNYYTSITKPKTTLHGWLRYYLHILADRVSPMRHFIYKDPITLQKTPIYKRSDIGELPLISPLLMLMLEDNNINIELPPYKSKSDRARIFKAIENGLRKLFKGKIIWLLPGRSGQSAYFYAKLGAKIGTSTDFRYIGNIINTFNTGKLGNNDNKNLHNTKNLVFLLEANLTNTTNFLAENIDYIKRNYEKAGLKLAKSEVKIIYWASRTQYQNNKPHKQHNRHTYDINTRDLPNPDFIISTNMINKKRFTDTNHSKINTQPIDILKRIMLLGKPSHTKIYITPSTEHGSAITQYDLKDLKKLAHIKIFDPSKYVNDPSIIKTPSDFCFRGIVK